MQALRVHAYGAAMQLDEIAPPVPGPGQILVRVAAASVNPVDWKVADGMLRERLPQALPYIPGGDFAGTVAALGDGVTDFRSGDGVFGMTGTPTGGPGYNRGAFAEFIVVKATNATRKPDSLEWAAAAAVPLAALTAWQAVHDRAEIKSGQRILIHAAAGGVGSFAVQFARIAGAGEIFATCSAVNADYVRGLGATSVIDYRATAFETVVGDLDVVLDLMGDDVQARSLGVLRPGGVLVNFWGAVMQEKAEAAGVRAIKVAVQPNGAQLAEIAELIDVGAVQVKIAKTYPIAEAAAAFAESRVGHTRGKIVLTMHG